METDMTHAKEIPAGYWKKMEPEFLCGQGLENYLKKLRGLSFTAVEWKLNPPPGFT